MVAECFNDFFINVAKDIGNVRTSASQSVGIIMLDVFQC
jgi:hypothetical protein